MGTKQESSFEYKLRDRVLQKLGMTEADVEKELSKYATKNSFEWFAEAVAEAMHSPHPRPMAAECMRQLKDILREGRLTDA